MQRPSSSPLISYESLLSRHEDFLCQTIALLEKRIADRQTCSVPFVKLLISQLHAHKQWLLNRTGDNNEDGSIEWGSIVATEMTADEPNKTIVSVRISGPKEADTTTILTDGEAAAAAIQQEIKEYDEMSRVLARAVAQASTILEHQKSFVERHDDTTDRKEIALLKQYNDVRDIGQQLIGIIADNRGVPIRSMYADGMYGVGRDD